MPRTRRFGRLRNAPRLNTANTAYEAWWAARDTREANIGGGTPRGQMVGVSITPFGLDLPDTDDTLLVKVTNRARQFLRTDVGTRAPDAASGAMRQAGFTAAKIVVFAGSGTSTVKRSEITNLQYLKRAGQSYTHPFGAATATDKEYEAFAEIATAVKDGNASASVSYQPERFYIS